MSYYLPFSPDIALGQRFGANPNWGPNPAGGHNGDDWLTPVGTPVRSPGDGVVVYAGRFDATYADNWGWNINYAGPMVILNMDGEAGPYFEFGHLSEVRVKTGQRVTAGQVIALTGADDGGTGVITGPHCHVGCLPPNFNLGTSTYGRVNPRLYMTRHWDGATVQPQSAPVQEDDMPLTKEDVEKIWTHGGIKSPTGGNQTIWATIVNMAKESRQNTATIAGLTKVLSSGSGLTEDQITEAVKAAFVELVRE